MNANLEFIILGGLLGILGQGIRVLVGLKKLYDTPDKYHQAFDASHTRLTLFIGFVTGGVAALSMNKPIDQNVAFSLIGIGYLGVDFLEGLFLSKVASKMGVDPGSQTVAAAVVTTPTTESGGAATTAVVATVTEGSKVAIEKVSEDAGHVLASAQVANTAMLAASTLSMPVHTFQINYPFPLSASVGLNSANHPADVLMLKTRLYGLGYNWTPLNSQVDKELVNIIYLFQSIIRGEQEVIPSQIVDGVVSVPALPSGNSSYAWLQAENAPRWTRLDAGSQTDRTLGYFNTATVQKDGFDFATSWLIDTIREAGVLYYQTYLKDNPKAPVMHINDMSTLHGGNTNQHSGHETGLMADIRLPHKSGAVGGITFESDAYDQNATRHMLKALHNATIKPKYLFFNDPVLIKEGLCRPQSGHDDHIHYHVRVPAKQLADMN